MTSGTTQALFIIVATVVFGIFIGLAFTAFGSEGLSTDIKNIFVETTEQATEKVGSKENNIDPDKVVALDDSQLSENLVNTGDLEAVNGATIEEQEADTVTFSSDEGADEAGVVLTNPAVEEGTYLFEYDITLLEEELETLGGYIDSDYNTFYVNGDPKDKYQIGANYDYYASEKVTVQVVLPSKNGKPPKIIYIQPNRNFYGTKYTVKVDDVSVRKVDDEADIEENNGKGNNGNNGNGKGKNK